MSAANTLAALAIINDLITVAANVSNAIAQIQSTIRAAQAAGVDITPEQLDEARQAREAVIGEIDAEIARRQGRGEARAIESPK